ncbi:uncharacterized protein BDZ99DRAFT_476361 [Mytilinidion resinicola]|uniref:Uncharacterized protein n=1 Tax=Mytilinidion resinicola TaxID=574789 RepID=A0A6A6YNP9_9PEZI|nr:uncharacterized protein BDZ99DRAFT_476361 [Mytilinidion resinicola]KAF2810158.1 hypothetical protein BDZ99DRAFT_476361 [Mytilinidion resinicola]
MTALPAAARGLDATARYDVYSPHRTRNMRPTRSTTLPAPGSADSSCDASLLSRRSSVAQGHLAHGTVADSAARLAGPSGRLRLVVGRQGSPPPDDSPAIGAQGLGCGGRCGVSRGLVGWCNWHASLFLFTFSSTRGWVPCPRPRADMPTRHRGSITACHVPTDLAAMEASALGSVSGRRSRPVVRARPAASVAREATGHAASADCNSSSLELSSAFQHLPAQAMPCHSAAPVRRLQPSASLFGPSGGLRDGAHFNKPAGAVVNGAGCSQAPSTPQQPMVCTGGWYRACGPRLGAVCTTPIPAPSVYMAPSAAQGCSNGGRAASSAGSAGQASAASIVCLSRHGQRGGELSSILPGAVAATAPDADRTPGDSLATDAAASRPLTFCPRPYYFKNGLLCCQ